MPYLIDPGTLHLAFGEVSVPKPLSSGMHVEIKKCPLCSNDKWKCSVNIENGWVFCQVCQQKGVHINQLIPQVEIDRVRDRWLGTTPPKAEKISLPPIPDLCQSLEALSETHPAHIYLTSRRIHPLTAHAAGCTWKPWGLRTWTKQGKPIFESLQGLIHPMMRRGELTAWQFEAVPRTAGSSLPKYVTAPGSQLGSSFFNFDAVQHEKRCIVVEGVFDALRLPFNAVAVCKDTLSKRQVKLLSTCDFDEIILLLDADRSDRHMQKELAKLKVIGQARAIRLEEGDPADWHEDALIRLLGLMPNPTISNLDTTRTAFLSIQELAEERAEAWNAK